MSKPSLLDLIFEGRAVLEWASYFALRPWLDDGPQGDGHPVLVLPGLMTSDRTMTPMRDLLTDLGFTAYPWEQGFNTGPHSTVLEALSDKIQELHAHHGEPVSVVGWSMGGAMAMALAARHPKLVRSVVTLGSPLTADPEHSSITSLFEAISGFKANDPALRELVQGHPKVPTTSIVSKGDGVVSWKGGQIDGPKHETVIVRTASHLGLPVHPAALMVVADRLRQDPKRWCRFAPPPGLLAALAQGTPSLHAQRARRAQGKRVQDAPTPDAGAPKRQP